MCHITCPRFDVRLRAEEGPTQPLAPLDLCLAPQSHLNNYLTRVRLSVSLFVCLSVAMVPTLRHLRLRAAQTVASSWVKFAQFVEDELRHLHVEKRGRWGA